MEWKIEGLLRCASLNGEVVVIESFRTSDDGKKMKARLKSDSTRVVCIHPRHLRSTVDPDTTAETMNEAIAHLRLSSDSSMRDVANSVMKGQYDRALETAAHWTYEKKKVVKETKHER